MVMGLEQLKTALMSNLMRHGIRWLEYAFVLLAAWLVAGMLIVQAPTQGSHQAVLMQAVKAPVRDVDEAFLQGVHLFGFVDKQASQNQAPTTPLVLQPSKLDMKLVGTVVAGSRSAAVVTMNGSKEQLVFFIQDELQSGVRLEIVEVMAIVVDNHGQHERISLEEGKAIVSLPSSSIRPQRQAAKRPMQRNRRIDRTHMQTELRDFSKLLSQARVTPHFTNKKADGFTISEIVKGSLYEQIGLINGDIIRKVNGESVVSAEQAMRMYKELQSATNIDVEIERSGSIQQVSYSIQ